MSHTPEATLATLAAASQDLLVPSESDYPFEPFRWQGDALFTPEALVASLDLPPTTPIETRTLEAFFAPFTRVAKGMDSRERARARRFAALQAAITNHLTDPVVYRVGSRTIATFIVGQTRDGTVVGLRTTVIET
jgi:hypothetical protein